MVTRRRAKPAVVIAVALAIFITALWQQRNGSAHQEEPAPATAQLPQTGAGSTFSRPVPPAESAAPAEERKDRWSRVGQVVPASERERLLVTLSLIERNGPFPYDRDGSVFANRERRLPARERGYYREYTVPTPGAGNRGARRIVQGRGGETWYTRDHYETFVRIDDQ